MKAGRESDMLRSASDSTAAALVDRMRIGSISGTAGAAGGRAHLDPVALRERELNVKRGLETIGVDEHLLRWSGRKRPLESSCRSRVPC
jgi:hypothetical protein